MSSAEKWKQYKFENLKRLKGFSFQFAEYVAPSAEWEHDHCEGCGATLAQYDAPEILHSGYCTTLEADSKRAKEPEFIKNARESGYKVTAKPDSKVWVCKECFEEFLEPLGWRVESGT